MLQEGRKISFLTVGFRNWRNTTTRLAQHEKSVLHLRCQNLLLRRENAILVNATKLTFQISEISCGVLTSNFQLIKVFGFNRMCYSWAETEWR